MTDAELIEAFIEGETDAYNTLVGRWERDVHNFILRYVGNREDARDLCQKTFVRAYQNLRRLILKVQKKAVDAYNRGDLDLEAFRKQVEVLER